MKGAIKMYRSNNWNLHTDELAEYIINQLTKVYGNDSNITLQSIDSYDYSNDSNYPGIRESVEFTMTDGRQFDCAFFHFDYYNFTEKTA
jgi:hypothetical protein